MILKADITKTSTGRYLFLFIFICGNSKCTRIQKIKIFSGEVNWVLLALTLPIVTQLQSLRSRVNDLHKNCHKLSRLSWVNRTKEATSEALRTVQVRKLNAVLVVC